MSTIPIMAKIPTANVKTAPIMMIKWSGGLILMYRTGGNIITKQTAQMSKTTGMIAATLFLHKEIMKERKIIPTPPPTK